MASKPKTTPAKTAKTAKTKVKKDRPKLVPYSQAPITEVPTDFDPAKHERLNRKSFASGDVYHEWRAVQADASAVQHRARAEEIRTYGDGASIRRARRLTDQLSKLKTELAAQGVEVDLTELIG